MIQFFKKNVFINSLMLLPYAVLLRLSSFVYPRALPKAEEYSYFFKALQIDHLTPFTQAIIACILVFVQAIMINRIVSKHRIAKANTSLAGMIYILLASLHPELLYLSPQLIGITFIIIACDIIFKTYKKPNDSLFIFNAALYLGLASLFYFPISIYLLFVLISFFILRSFKIKDFLQLFFSFLLPLYFLFFIVYIFSGKWLNLSAETLDYFELTMFSLPKTTDQYILAVTLSLGIFIGLLSYTNYVSKKSIQSQKKIDLIYYLLLISGLLFIVSDKTQFSNHLFSFFPLSILLHMTILDIRSKIIPEFIHLALIGLLLSLHFVL